MNDNLINLLKERPYVISRVFINNYHNLGITEEELVVIMVIMDIGDKVLYVNIFRYQS